MSKRATSSKRPAKSFQNSKQTANKCVFSSAQKREASKESYYAITSSLSISLYLPLRSLSHFVFHPFNRAKLITIAPAVNQSVLPVPQPLVGLPLFLSIRSCLARWYQPVRSFAAPASVRFESGSLFEWWPACVRAAARSLFGAKSATKLASPVGELCVCVLVCWCIDGRGQCHCNYLVPRRTDWPLRQWPVCAQ